MHFFKSKTNEELLFILTSKRVNQKLFKKSFGLTTALIALCDPIKSLGVGEESITK